MAQTLKGLMKTVRARGIFEYKSGLNYIQTSMKGQQKELIFYTTLITGSWWLSLWHLPHIPSFLYSRYPWCLSYCSSSHQNSTGLNSKNKAVSKRCFHFIVFLPNFSFLWGKKYNEEKMLSFFIYELNVLVLFIFYLFIFFFFLQHTMELWSLELQWLKLCWCLELLLL